MILVQSPQLLLNGSNRLVKSQHCTLKDESKRGHESEF